MKGLISVISVFFLLLVPGVAGETQATEKNGQLLYLLRQFSAAPQGIHAPSAWVNSYEGVTRAYTYDQALAALVFTHAEDRDSARKVLNALWNAQNRSGGWYFSYPMDDPRQVSGAIAWAVIAANAYHAKFQSTEFDPMARKALDYLESLLVPIQHEGISSRAVRFALKDIPETAWDETQVVSVEHNLDAFSAFQNYAGLGAAKYRKISSEIRQFLESMWVGDHFHAGYNLEARKPNTEELYLDTQSWGVLALGNRGSQGENFLNGLKMVCDEFSTRIQKGSQELFGFFDYRPTQGLAPEKFIWSEGTMGVLAALQTAAPEMKVSECENQKPSDFLRTIDAMTRASQGVAYATPNHRDFSTRASVAGTAWTYFARQRVNPFRPFRALEPIPPSFRLARGSNP